MHLLIQVILFIGHTLVAATLLQVDPVLSRNCHEVSIEQNHAYEVRNLKAERYIGANGILSPTLQILVLLFAL